MSDDLREGSKPRCPECGGEVTWRKGDARAYCQEQMHVFTLDSEADFTQFFPIAAMENQRLVKELKLATKPYKELEEALAFAEQWKQRAESARANLLERRKHDDANREERNQLAERAEAAESKLGEMREALQVIAIALKEPAGGEYWSARKFLDKRNIYNDDLDGERVLLRVAVAALAE